MSQFEFLMTFLSVLLAIGLAEVISGWGRLIRTPERERLYPLFVFWSLMLIPTAVMLWSQLWGYQAIQISAGYKVLLLAVPTLCYVLVAFLLTPVSRFGGREDMETTYWRLAPFVFPLLMAMNLLGVAVAWELSGYSAFAPESVVIWRASMVVVPVGLVQLSLAFIKHPTYHWVVGLLSNGLMLIGFSASPVLHELS